MSNCYPILDSYDNFHSYSNNCTTRVPRRGAGAVCSNDEEVRGKRQDEPDTGKCQWISRQWCRSTKLFSGYRLQDAKRSTHLSNQLVV